MSTIQPIRVGVESSLFVGASIPTRVRDLINQSIKDYGKAADDLQLTDSWFLALIRSGDVSQLEEVVKQLSTPMILPFVATVALTHIGSGNNKDDLWVYAQMTPVLESLRVLLGNRLSEVEASYETATAIIDLGKVNRESPVRLPDLPLVTSFQIENLIIIREDIDKIGTHYYEQGKILL